MATLTPALGLLDKVFVGLLLVVFGGIVLHAPLTVGLETIFPAYGDLFKAWKEVLLGPAVVLATVLLTRRRRWAVLRNPLMYLILAYAALHVLLIPLFFEGWLATLSGLLIDLRYLLFFVLVYVAVGLYPSLRRLFLAVFVVGALLVLGFAILQVTVLPPDILKYLGYGPTTIAPFLTVDQNMDYIRINSTLRGPNPLGAYAVITLTLLLAFWLRSQRRWNTWPFIGAVIAVGSTVALWASYSRSALVAAIVAVGLVLLVTFWKKLNAWVWISAAALVLTLGGISFAARETEFVSNVLLHENAAEGNDINSNEGHADSLADGVTRTSQQPLGAGIGSTGSASLYGDDPVIIENQYLFIAHEAGWLGLVLFLVIFAVILRELWRRRADWLSLGVLASGVGLALIGLLLPVWVDDTVALIWWGLAGLAVGGTYGRTIHQTSKRTA